MESTMEELSRCRQTLEKIEPDCALPRTRTRNCDLMSSYFEDITLVPLVLFAADFLNAAFAN